MALSNWRVQYLLETYTSGKATPEEEQELFEWAMMGDDGPVKEQMRALLSRYSPEDTPKVEWETIYQNILEHESVHSIKPVVNKPSWWRWSAAAALLVLILSTYYFLTVRNEEKTYAENGQLKKNDIAPPDTIHAHLTLGNGERILLGSANTGTIAARGSVSVVRFEDGSIAYKGGGGEVEYHTLYNPRGSQVINLVLVDGSRVWLNAESSLTFPSAFVGPERKVSITGEAYFEVAANPSLPFIVHKGQTSVKVLGTHFNVRAFDDESLLRITLLEGSILVSSEGSNQTRQVPVRQQAIVSPNGNVALLASVDLKEVMAWKNGMFSYSGADIETITRDLARWYNVEIVMEEPIREVFYAEVSRNTNISTLLKMLEATKAVSFEIEKKQIRVSDPSR